jgi:hypothetical protein
MLWMLFSSVQAWFEKNRQVFVRMLRYRVNLLSNVT